MHSFDCCLNDGTSNVFFAFQVLNLSLYSKYIFCVVKHNGCLLPCGPSSDRSKGDKRSVSFRSRSGKKFRARKCFLSFEVLFLGSDQSKIDTEKTPFSGPEGG